MNKLTKSAITIAAILASIVIFSLSTIFVIPLWIITVSNMLCLAAINTSKWFSMTYQLRGESHTKNSDEDLGIYTVTQNILVACTNLGFLIGGIFALPLPALGVLTTTLFTGHFGVIVDNMETLNEELEDDEQNEVPSNLLKNVLLKPMNNYQFLADNLNIINLVSQEQKPAA